MRMNADDHAPHFRYIEYSEVSLNQTHHSDAIQNGV